MSWEIFLIISMISFALAGILQKILMRDEKADPIAYAIAFQILAGVFAAFYALSIGFDLNFSLIPNTNLVAAVILYAAFNIFLFSALKLEELSQVTIITLTSVIWTVLIGIIFLNDSFSLVQMTGGFLILIAAVLVSVKKFRINFSKGNFYALGAALCLGIALANDSFIFKGGVDIPSYSAFVLFVPGFITAFFYSKRLKNIKNIFHLDSFWKMLAFALLYATAVITIYSAIKIGNNLSQIASLQKLQNLFIILLAIVFLKEREGVFRKISAVALAVAGAFLVL